MSLSKINDKELVAIRLSSGDIYCLVAVDVTKRIVSDVGGLTKISFEISGYLAHHSKKDISPEVEKPKPKKLRKLT
jgi:hypothetical protein